MNISCYDQCFSHFFNMDHKAGVAECKQYFRNDYDYKVQEQLDSPMPWIGMYIAAASAVCSVAMAVDAFNGFRSRRFWFPCKYFSLNAFSLTVLAVATKLPVDLTSLTKGYSDKCANISSLALMSTAMSNFMTSLGSMENEEVVLNIAALGILVITITANILIHNFGMYSFLEVSTSVEDVAVVILMFLLLVTLCCLAVMVPSAKRYIASKYNELHKTVSNKQVEWGNSTVGELKIMVKRYWVMEATGSPQFVMARSVISGTSGVMCTLVAITLIEVQVRMQMAHRYIGDASSKYKWSITWILFIQSVGVVFGTIAPLLRWFVASWFKISETGGRKSLRDEFKVEKYWTSRLVEWRDKSLPLHIQHRRFRKLLHDAKAVLLNICIGVQILLVSSGKLVLLISAKFGDIVSNDIRGSESIDGIELDFSRYVLLLEGEAQLPNKILKSICSEVDKLIRIGENKQPKNLIRLLKKSTNFNGLGQFDSNEVPSLNSQEPPNYWSLTVVTLTSILISLTNMQVAADKTDQLLAGVSEGLSLVKLIEKTLDRKGELESIRKAANVVWVEVELYRKWGDKDLQSLSVRGGTHKETLQNLASIAEKTVKDFTSETEDILMQNPLNWPVKAVAANSMYRTTKTILLWNNDGEHQSDDELFERLSIIISNILLACFTNLVQVITFKCHKNAIEERVESVRQAAILLGESKEILEILQQRRQLLPSLDPEKAANIDEWRAAFMAEDIENPSASVSEPNEEQASVEDIVG